MAVTEVQIAKLALQHLGDRWDITTLSESTPEAEQVNLVFDNVRDMVLRSHPWTFATKFTSPTALAGTVPAQWDYMFTYPSDALRVTRIVNPLGDDQPPIKFAIAKNSSDAKVIMTNEEEPEFEYIQQITDPAEFDPSFVTAFSYRLAQYIAIPITGDRELMRDMKILADTELSMAAAENSNEGIEAEHTRDPDWITARA